MDQQDVIPYKHCYQKRKRSGKASRERRRKKRVPESSTDTTSNVLDQKTLISHETRESPPSDIATDFSDSSR